MHSLLAPEWNCHNIAFELYATGMLEDNHFPNSNDYHFPITFTEFVRKGTKRF